MSRRIPLIAMICALTLASGEARAQSAARRPVRAGEVTGLELGLEGSLEVSPGGALRWLMTLYEVVGQDRLRPAADGEIRILASYHPEAPADVIRTDRYGRAQAEIAVPESRCCAFDVMFEARSRSRVQRRFQVRVEIGASRRVEVLSDRTVVAPGETFTVFGRALRIPEERGLDGRPLRISVTDGQGRRVIPERRATTDALGGFAQTFTAPEDVSTLRASVRLDSGEQAVITVQVRQRSRPDLLLRAAPDRSLISPGQAVSIEVAARLPNGAPVQGAVVSVGSPIVGEEAAGPPGAWRPIRTDARGRATLSWTPAASSLAPPVEEVSTTVYAVHPGLGAAQRPVAVRIARNDYLAGIAVEGGALIPGLPGRVFVRVVRADGSPAPGGVAVSLESELLGDLSGVTGESGFVALESEAELRPDAAGRDRCGGTTAAAATIRVGEGSRAVRLERCLPVDPDATVRVRVSRPVVAPSERLTVTLIRAPAVRRWPTVVTLLRLRDQTWVPLRQHIVAAERSELEVSIPPDAVGEVLVRARPLVGTARQEVRGGSALVWSVPGATPRAELATPAESTLRLSASGTANEPLRGLFLVVPVDDGPALLDRLETLSDHPAAGPDRMGLRGLLAARTPRDLAVPAVLRGGEAVTIPAPDSPVDLGVLRDPWRARARYVRGRLGLVMRALEIYAERSIPDGLADVAHRSRGRWEFNRELLGAVAASPLLGAAGARGLGGEPLTLEDLQAMDPAFTFDNMARRITRARLLRVLVALRSFVRSHDLDLQWSENTSPEAWLVQLIDGDTEYGEPMFERDQLFDGWGRPLAIRRAPAGRTRFQFLSPLPPGWELVSAGPDGRFGTGDDLFDPLARVLPSGGVYAEAVGEDALMARLHGVELGQATIEELVRTFDVEDGFPVQGAEQQTSELGWTELPSPLDPPDDIDRFVRSWLSVPPLPGRAAELDSGTAQSAVELGHEPRRYTAVGLVWSRAGWSWDRVEIDGGDPLVIEADLPARLVTGEPLEVPLTVSRLPGGPESLRLEAHATGVARVDLEGGSHRTELDLGARSSARAMLRLSADRAGRGSVRLSFSSGDGALTRELDLPIRAEDRGLLRSQVAATGLSGPASLPLEIPPDATEVRTKVIVTSYRGLVRDPGLSRWIEDDPALLAWSYALTGRELPEDLSIALARASTASGVVTGSREELSTACAVVAWSATERDDVNRRRVRLSAVRWLRSHHQSQLRHAARRREERVPAATLAGLTSTLAALTVGASGLAEARRSSRDPLAGHVDSLRDDVRHMIRTHRDQLGLMARGAAALLLIDARDARGRAMFALARDHLGPGLRGGLVVDLSVTELPVEPAAVEEPPEEDEPATEEEEDEEESSPPDIAEQIVATAALAIAARQLGEEELAAQLARGLAARAHVAGELGGEPLFWLLAASVYGVLGRGEPERVTVDLGGGPRTVELRDGMAVVSFEPPRPGRRTSVTVDPGSLEGELLLARVEARYVRPQRAQDQGPLRAVLDGDPGFAGERAALEITLSNTTPDRLERPTLLVSLPASAILDERARAALGAASGVESVAEPDRHGVIEIRLAPIEGFNEVRVPLPVRWLAAGEVSGFGLAAFEAARAWELTVVPNQSVEVGWRR